MKKSDGKLFLEALDELELEKGMDREELIQSIENALFVAYKKQYKDLENATVQINRKSGDVKIYSIKNVVENVENDILEISLEDAKKVKKSVSVGDTVEIEINSEEFKRKAIQNAKQIVIQKVREFEKQYTYQSFKKLEFKIVTAEVKKTDENGNVYIEMGKLEAVVSFKDLLPNDNFKQGDKILVYVSEVEEGTKYSRILITRRSPELVIKLFEREIPEIENGLINIVGISREAGERTKIALASNDENLDIRGACIGKNGSRINSILKELSGEKIDLVLYDEDIRIFVKNALSPAEIEAVEIVKEEEEDRLIAKVDVLPTQFTSTVGKKGQNVRLASKLCDIKIVIETLEVDNISEEEYNG